MKIKHVKLIECSDWDDLVMKTYGRHYCFQQQDDCRDRGTYNLTVPEEYDDSEMNDSVPEIVNHPQMGVKFDVWLSRDPKQPLAQDSDKDEDKFSIERIKREDDWKIPMWWERNFYPNIQAVANDLHAKGLLEAGEYVINIDW